MSSASSSLQEPPAADAGATGDDESAHCYGANRTAVVNG
jgi:hypothetical protein